VLIATLAAALGITAKSPTCAVGGRAAKLEAPLWASDIDESVAIAAARLPSGDDSAKPRSVKRLIG
jgi:hypothetical protein